MIDSNHVRCSNAPILAISISGRPETKKLISKSEQLRQRGLALSTQNLYATRSENIYMAAVDKYSAPGNQAQKGYQLDNRTSEPALQ